jgi:aspartate carbamoyltransferase catalytic subunit
MPRHVKCFGNQRGGWYERAPDPGFADMFTITEKKGSLKGLKIAIIGDNIPQQGSQKHIWGMLKLGADEEWQDLPH